MSAGAVQRYARSAQRIISIPLSRPRTVNPTHQNPTHRPNSAASLIFYHYQIHNAPEPSKSKEKEGELSEELTKPKTRWRWPEEGVVKWAQTKATNTWISWGKAPEKSWKHRTFTLGEKLVDRIDFEELALKTIDPALGPKLLTGSSKSDNESEQEFIQLLYPSSIQSSETSLSALRSLLDHRMPKHRRGVWTWVLISPFTAPFMIIPVIPNLPFFFCVWRAWSHYRAFKASEYLISLINNGHIIAEPSNPLDNIYRTHPFISHPTTPSEKSPLNPNSDTEMLLSPEAIPEIVTQFELKSSTTADMKRAMEQCRLRTNK